MANLIVSPYGFEVKCEWCKKIVWGTGAYPTDGSADYEALHEEADEALRLHEEECD